MKDDLLAPDIALLRAIGDVSSEPFREALERILHDRELAYANLTKTQEAGTRAELERQKLSRQLGILADGLERIRDARYAGLTSDYAASVLRKAFFDVTAISAQVKAKAPADGLFHAELYSAKNIGFDLECGRCAEVFYCGSSARNHDDRCQTHHSLRLLGKMTSMTTIPQPREERRNRSHDEMSAIMTLAGFVVRKSWELANGYWPDHPDYDDVREPWWLFLTDLGLIRIGWRKRVIAIDWEACEVRGIVTDDDVTKDATSVHAWKVEKAVEYLRALRRLGMKS